MTVNVRERGRPREILEDAGGTSMQVDVGNVVPPEGHARVDAQTRVVLRGDVHERDSVSARAGRRHDAQRLRAGERGFLGDVAPLAQRVVEHREREA